MMKLENKNILLGVTGGIAAYKAVELLRLLKKAGANVNVIMTDSAQKFVGKTTFVDAKLCEDTMCLLCLSYEIACFFCAFLDASVKLLFAVPLV